MKQIAVLLVALGGLNAATVTSSTTCTIYADEVGPVLDSQSGAFGCELSTFSASPRAITEYSVFQGTDLVSISILADSYATPASYGDPQLPFPASSIALAEISVGVAVGSTGAVRDGILRYTLTHSAGRTYNAGSYLQLISSFLNGGCEPEYVSLRVCRFNDQPSGDNDPVSRDVNVQLGTHINVLLTARTSAGGDTVNGGGHAFADLDLQLRFFEADGVTPVENAAEPATLALVGMATAMLTVIKRRKSRHRECTRSRSSEPTSGKR